MSLTRFPQFTKTVEGCPPSVAEIVYLPFELQSEATVFAILIGVGEHYLLVPISDENVVLLNGEPTESVVLSDGDRIQYQEDQFVFGSGNGEGRPQVSPTDTELVGETTLLVNHRINNFFQVINGGGFLLDTGIANKDFDLVSRGWSTVKAKQEQLANLLSKVVSLNHLPVLTVEKDELNELINRSLEAWSAKSTSEGFKFELNQSDEIYFQFDRSHLAMAIDALLDLAAKASFPETRLIRIDLSVRETFVHLGIGYEGTGISIQPENSQNIRTQANETSGGVEFNFSRSLVRAHGGDLVLTQHGVDQRCINIYLPLNATDASK